MGLKEWLFGAEVKKSHEGSGFIKGTRPAIILERLCAGDHVSGWSACQLLNTHNGDRDLRRVRRRLKMLGIGCVTHLGGAKNGRDYKITALTPWQAERARALIVGKAA